MVKDEPDYPENPTYEEQVRYAFYSASANYLVDLYDIEQPEWIYRKVYLAST